MHDNELILRWIKLGGACGLSSMIVFAVVAAAPLPDNATAVGVACFAAMLSIGSYGLSRLLALNRNTVSLQIAAVSNVVAGALVTAMLFVQLAVRHDGRGGIDDFLWLKLRRVDLGLDVAWDVYICLGTILFGWNMLRHPKFGKIWGGLGLGLGAALAVLNLATFPTPPASAGLVDLGPLVALWYAAVSVQTLRSVKWARGCMEERVLTAAA